MGGKKTKLTDWPDNLKDVIDWFLRVGGKDKESLGDDKKFELPKAVNALGDYGEAKNVLESGSIAGNFGYVADGLRVFIGYNKSGSQELKGDGVGLSSHGGYASSYKDSAKWDGGSSNPTTYAHILLGSFPLLYYGLTHLLWRCTNGGWQNQILQGDGQGTDLSYFMNYMGYNISQLKSDVNGTQIATLLVTDSDSITDLKNFCNSASTMTYPDFLQKLHQKGTVAGSVMNAPLYKLYTDSHAYLTTNWKSHMLNDIPQTKAEIEATLTGYSEAVKALNPGSSQKLSTAYLTLLAKIKEAFIPDLPSPAPSAAASAVGGILGTAALGAGAALATNVGGITTTLKSLILIFK